MPLQRSISLFILIFFGTLTSALGQELPEYIKDKAIPITGTINSDDSIYSSLSGFKTIMVGEMHGTNEPAAFLLRLIKIFTAKGDSIQVGLELSDDEMRKYLSERTDSSIYHSDFFTKAPVDGRENMQWAEIIATVSKLKNARLFFYDEIAEDRIISRNRDSMMYVKIKRQIQKRPNWKTLTLSGNIHNRLLPWNERKTMTYYLHTDPELKLSGKICSIDHHYNSGSMYNNTGKGIEWRQVASPVSPYSLAVAYNSYFLLLPEYEIGNYNALYFTKIVTAAKMVNAK